MRSSRGRTKAYKVLILDTDKEFCRTLAAVGRSLGVGVVFCHRPEQLEVARYLRFDAVVVASDSYGEQVEAIATFLGRLISKRPRVFLVGDPELDPHAVRRVRAVTGFLSKETSPTTLLDAVLTPAQIEEKGMRVGLG